MVCKCMDGIGFGWKVHGMVHGKRCMAFFYTPVGIRKAKRRPFLFPGCGTLTLEYLATQKVTHILLPPNMDSSSFAHHHTWPAGFSQMGAKTDMTLFLSSTMQFRTKLYLIILNKLSISSWHRQASSGQIPYPSSLAVVPTGLSEITPYPLLWYSQISTTNTIPCLFCSTQRSLQTNTIFGLGTRLTCSCGSSCRTVKTLETVSSVGCFYQLVSSCGSSCRTVKRWKQFRLLDASTSW